MIRSKSTVSAAASSLAVTVTTVPLEFSIRFLYHMLMEIAKASISGGTSLAEVTLC